MGNEVREGCGRKDAVGRGGEKEGGRDTEGAKGSRLEQGFGRRG